MQSFIDEIAPFAIKHGLANDILPSLLIAQGVLESGGKSELATEANNLFGIKKGSGWENKPVYTVKTKEYDKDGNLYFIDASFRKYGSYEECIQDLILKYVEGLPWEAHNRYQDVVGEKDYSVVTQTLYEVGYATDFNYPSKLNSIIERYDLTKYDEEETNMVKIFIDPGHGGHDPGAIGYGLRESDLTLKISLKIRDILQREYQNVQVKMSRTTDVFLTLGERARLSNVWNADLLLSVHINATPSGYGYEDFIFNGSVGQRTIQIQNAINESVVQATGWRNRGKKRKNLQVLRSSKASAVLTESGFIDNPNDSKLLKDDSFLDKVARGHVNGIAKAFNLKRKTVAHSPAPSKPQITIKEEELLMSILKGSSGTLNNAFLKYLEDAAKRGTILDKWAKQFKAGELSIDDAFLLYVYIKEELNKQ